MPDAATGKNNLGLNASGKCGKASAEVGCPHLPPRPKPIALPSPSTWAALARVRSWWGCWVRDWHLATQGTERDSQEPLCVPLAVAPTHKGFAESPILPTGAHSASLFYIHLCSSSSGCLQTCAALLSNVQGCFLTIPCRFCSSEVLFYHRSGMRVYKPFSKHTDGVYSAKLVTVLLLGFLCASETTVSKG